MFAVVGDKLQVADFGIKQGHEKWLEGLGVSAEEFPELTRGYIHASGVYFYRGHDYSSDVELERQIPHLLRKLRPWIHPRMPVFAGVEMGKIGEIWPPKKRLGLASHLYLFSGATPEDPIEDIDWICFDCGNNDSTQFRIVWDHLQCCDTYCKVCGSNNNGEPGEVSTEE